MTLDHFLDIELIAAATFCLVAAVLVLCFGIRSHVRQKRRVKENL